MKKANLYLCCVISAACFAPTAYGAGTYYTGGSYQSPQTRYVPTGTSPSAYNPYTGQYSGTQYQRPTTSQIPYTPVNSAQPVAQQPQQQRSMTAQNSNQTTGFYLGAGISRESAAWEYTMKTAGSKLSYDNLSWNVFDLNGGYAFGDAAFGLKIDAGFKYGMQSGESKMVDDDISAGGTPILKIVDNNTGALLGYVYHNQLSVGTSSGGSMLGFNLGLGLTDKLSFNKLKFTPSIGYRTLSYTLTTNNNYGMAIETGYCYPGWGAGEIQCDPIVVVTPSGGGTPIYVWGDKNVPSGEISTGTFYYFQPGTSHKYDVSWNGPYLAMDMDYLINESNAVTARVELGLPVYTSTGDQPGRPEWQHPKSIEDSASLGSAYHFGLAALWSTAVSNSLYFQLGLTYDYYTVSGATAKTYLNGLAFNVPGWASGTSYDQILSDISGGNLGGNSPAVAQQIFDDITDLKNACPGWVCTTESEVDSFYKSVGIRIGIAGKF